MTFVTPLLLAGAAFIAVPIVLHLIMRQKPREIEFPALRLVRKRHETNQRRMQLRHLLLLLLRMAAIALLAFALARPSMKFSGSMGSQEAPVAAALIFDCAPRMDYRQGNKTRLEAAGELGKWLLAQLPAESQVAVLDTKAGPSVFQIDRGAAKQRIERLATVPNSVPLTQVTGQALRLLGESELARKEIYVFTDLASAAWPVDDSSALQSEATAVAGAGIYLVDVGAKKPTNYALSEPELSSQVLSASSPLGLRVELTVLEAGVGGENAAGGEAAQDGTVGGSKRNRTVEVYLVDSERKPQKVDQRAVDLGGDFARKIEFVVGSLDVGTHQGYLQIVGQDGLAADDARYFSVDVKAPWRILIVSPGLKHSYTPFLENMIAPEEYQLSGQARFQCDTIGQNELSEAKLGDYSAVCLLDPQPLDARQWRRLADYASEGHGVAVFLGRNVKSVDSFNEPAAQELLAGPLVRQARSPNGDLILSPQNLQHPVLSDFREITGSIPWKDTPVFRYWQLAGLAEGAGTIVPYSDGSPAVIERSLGDGLAVTMTTPISDRAQDEPWNLLPVADQWPFTILINRLMLYLVGSTGQRLNYLAGQTAVVPLEADRPHRSYLVTAPQGVQFSVAVDPKQNALMVTSTDREGNYRVRAGGRAAGVDTGFSVNLSPAQTDLRRAGKEQLDEVFGTLKYTIAENRGQIERDVSMGRVGRELFPLLILLLAVILGVECWLSNRFYREVKKEG
ncbi:MAG: BatA domain-containing protein [Pirellulales bacterium]|nr:BatA domain-containing protein [Pirellulales bacterium]